MQPIAEVKRLRWHELHASRSTRVWIALVVFTVFYFVDVCLRASAKYFWYDELLTLYFARLPDLRSLWGALQTGIDSNPPGFDLLNRAIRAVFGEGLIAMRLPEIAAFWVMCLCLFKFVERRAGILAGFIAMTLPMLTGGYYYAYEARPLILVAACAALALLCWDNALEFQRSHRWLTGFSLALFTALMLHCYAVLLVVPFGVTELVRAFRDRRANWPFWAALTLPVLLCFPLYVSLARIFSTFSKGTDFLFYYRAIWPRVLEFYGFLILPCSAVILLALACFAFDKGYSAGSQPLDHSRRFTSQDFLLTLGFLALPAFGLLIAQIVHTPYFSRYFLSTLLGVCIAFAIPIGNRQRWVCQLLLGVVLCGLGLNFARIARHRLNGTGESLVEPSSQIVLETTPKEPLHEHLLLRDLPNDSMPIAVLNPLDFLYILQYAPNLASRIYYVHYTERDSSFRGLRDFRRWSPVTYNAPAAARAFVDAHPQFYVFCDDKRIFDLNGFDRLASIRFLKTTQDHLLLQMERNSSAATSLR
jgi:Dolichyl-phosphate-mannose-protein mannosyltransferase